MVRYQYLPELVIEHRCKKIMEVGVWNGGTANHMISAAVSFDDRADNVYYYGFDLFDEFVVNEETGDVKIPPPIDDVWNMVNVPGTIADLIKGDSRETVPNFVENYTDKMDMIFIDGGHGEDVIEADWNNVQPLIDKNTVIVFDDYWLPEHGWGCNKAVSELNRDVWDVEVMPKTDSIRWKNKDYSLGVVKVMMK